MFQKHTIPTYQEWLNSRPFALQFGAETGGGEGGGSGGGEGGSGSGEGGEGGAGEGSGGTGDEGGSGGTGEGEGGGSGEFVRLPKKEADALRREVAESRKARNKAEKDAKAERERVAAEQGRFQEIAEEREKERDEAVAKAEAAEYNLDQFQRNLRVNNIASRLGFKDPGDAIRYLDDDVTADDESAERALKKLAEQKDYLVDKKKGSGGPMNGGSKGLTLDDIRNMSQDEINANWEAVQAAMAAAG